MKKHLLLLLSVLIAVPAMARDFQYTYQGQTLTYTVIDEAAKTCQVAARNHFSGKLVLPSHPKDDATEGKIEYTLVRIGAEAFYNCSALTSVTIPNSVTSIGHHAFLGCSGLTSVSIPNSVTSIGHHAFLGCSGLTSVTIPNSVGIIGDFAFAHCKGLTSVTIPNSVTEIGNSAFVNCRSMTSITIPNSVTKIGDGAFSCCIGLTSVTIPNSVTKIGDGAFNDCSGLTSVTIPNSVTKIGDDAFRHCNGLTSVTIPNSVTVIGGGVYSGCSGLTSVTIPGSVTEIGNYAFAHCRGLTSVTYLAEEPVECERYIFASDVYEKAALYYLKSAEEKIAATEPWSLFKNRIGRDASSSNSYSNSGHSQNSGSSSHSSYSSNASSYNNYNSSYSNYSSGQSSSYSRRENKFNAPKDNVISGFSFGYVQKQWVFKNDDENEKVGFFDNKNYVPGIQFGIRITPQFGYGFAMNFGLYYEYYFSGSEHMFDEYGEYWLKMREHSLYMPIHLKYDFNFSKWFQLSVYGGLGLDCGLSGKISVCEEDDSYGSESIYSPDYNQKRFNASYEYGAAMRIQHVQFDFVMSRGFVNMSADDTYKVYQNKQFNINISLLF